MGCASVPPILDDPWGNCRNRAVYCALEAGENSEVIIFSGPSKIIPSMHHAQTKVKINNQWQWLRMNGDNCYVSDQDQFDPINKWNVEDFIKYISYYYKKK